MLLITFWIKVTVQVFWAKKHFLDHFPKNLFLGSAIIVTKNNQIKMFESSAATFCTDYIFNFLLHWIDNCTENRTIWHVDTYCWNSIKHKITRLWQPLYTSLIYRIYMHRHFFCWEQLFVVFSFNIHSDQIMWKYFTQQLMTISIKYNQHVCQTLNLYF